MKNARRYMMMALLLIAAGCAFGRSFVKNEKLYVKMDQSFDWTADNANLYLYLWTPDVNDKWLKLTAEKSGSKIYVGIFDAAGSYTKCIVVRKNSSDASANWNNVWNQTCDLDIPDYKNCNILSVFSAKTGTDACTSTSTWKTYAPPTSLIGTVSALKSGGVTEEVIHICSDAAGDPFSLRVNLNSAKTAYAYDDVNGHGWYYSTNGTSWTSVDSYAGVIRNEEKERDWINNTLPTTLPTTMYYYLHSNTPAGRRLIKLLPDQNCALNCEITSFEYAISAVNADNNTYTLDGMVAFGKASGNLVISCDGISKTITNPKSPQSFSLEGLPAATTTGKTTTATASFSGDGSCKKEKTINVPNATEAMKTKTVDVLTGKPVVLTPENIESSNEYRWTADGTEIIGASQIFTVPAGTGNQTIEFVYKEFYPISGTMEDMMANGNYENASFNYGKYGKKSTISDYNYWGIHQQSNPDQEIHFYDTCTLRGADGKLDNGFAVVRNANKFHPSFAKIKAKEGNNFALFDAASGTEGGNKMAWYASTASNAKLKLKKGTTYVLSFWAANLNNFGEMDNAARFRFRIQYGAKTWYSQVLNLGSDEFRNNLWHQHSETFYSDGNYDNVTISVVNENTNVLEIGNDFALDDIQFHAISSVSKVVKSQQKFIVTIHEPTIDNFTATVQPVDCDSTTYKVAMSVTYQNPSGQIIIKDKTTGQTYNYTVPTGWAYDTPYTLNKTITIATKEAKHDWEAYFSDWTTAQKTATTTLPGFPKIETKNYALSGVGCTDLTTTLTFDLDYTYQCGKLTYWVDGGTKQTGTYSENDVTQKTRSGLAIPDIPADGKDTHKLHVSFDGANSCVKEYVLPEVPFSPVITSVTVSGVPAQVLCTDDDYTIQVTIKTPYDATGRNLVLKYDDKSGAQTKTVVATGTSTVVSLKLSNLGGAKDSVVVAYEATPACTTSSAAFVPPFRLACNVYKDSICDGESYTLHGFNIKTPAVGVDTFTLGYDSLILTTLILPLVSVGANIVICNNENLIRMPFTATTGLPDTYSIRIDGKDYAVTVVGGDLQFDRPVSLVPGDYGCVLTVGQTGIACETTVAMNLRIDAADIMYRKWEDVLFIDNSSKRFVGYQWYDNGVAISGATEQYLYQEGGLPGIYCCRVTTSDGQVFYTCEEPFEQVTRSRDKANEQEQRKEIRRYEIAPNLFVIVEEVGEKIVTRKELIVQ